MNRYGAELESDFQQKLGLDLGAMWRARKFARISRMIHWLPRDTHFSNAVANDDEHVRAVLKASEGQPSKPSISLAEWSVEAEILSDIFDSLGQNTNATLAAGGAKNLPKVRPRSRPETSYAAVKHELAQERFESIKAKIFRGRSGPKVDP